MEVITSFGTWVRQRRRALGLTQAELARAVSCATITIRKVEADERRPSSAIASLLADALRIGDTERDRFIAVARAEHSALRLSPPGAGTSPTWPRSLPVPMTRTVGRSDLIEQIVADLAIAGGPARLITLAGPPGVGKTRLAIEVGALAGRLYDVPVVYVELAGTSDRAGIEASLNAAVTNTTGSSTGGLPERLGNEPILLVLDNFEHILVHTEVVIGLLGACTDLACVVTSRAPLDAYGEHVVPLEPLAAPTPSEVDLDPSIVHQWPAVDLFVQRARAVARDLSFDRSDLSIIAGICRQVDGLPLAIELAAAGLRHQSLTDVSNALRAGTDAGDRQYRGGTDRHRTMESAVSWSRDLLDASERSLLDVIACFPAGCRADDLAAVANRSSTATASSLQVLVDHGLVARGSGFAGPRFRAFEVVRRAVRSSWSATDPRHAVLERIRRRTAELADEFGRTLTIGNDATSRAPLVDAYDTVAWTLQHWLGAGHDVDAGADLVYAMTDFWQGASLIDEGTRWATRLLEASDDPRHVAIGCSALAIYAWARGDGSTAVPLLDRAIAASTASGHQQILAEAAGLRGVCGFVFGTPDYFDDLHLSCRIYDGLGDPGGRMVARIRLGTGSLRAGDLDAASDYYRDALDLALACDNLWGVATARSNLGEVLGRSGRLEESLELRLAGFDAMHRLGSPWYETTVVAGVGHALLALGHPSAATRCYGIVDRVLGDLNAPMLPIAMAAWNAGRTLAAEQLGERYEADLAVGRSIAMTPDSLRELVDEFIRR